MKRTTIPNFMPALAALITLLPLSSYAASGDDFEFHGYFRAGARSGNTTDTSSTSGCIHNKGTSGNEFRLGNECEDYGELTLVAYQLRGKAPTDPYFKSLVTMAFKVPGLTQYENVSGGSNPPPALNLIEAYIDAGNFADTNLKYWVGKRFYRDASIHMNDDFYFASTSGSGAGVYDINMPSGKLAVAYLLEQSNPVAGSTINVNRTKGNFGDVRWTDIGISENNRLDFWGMYGQTNTNPTLGLDHQGGFALGLKYRYLLTDGTNTLSLQYGSKLLESLGFSGVDNPVTAAAFGSANRVRAVEDLVVQPMTNLGLEFAARYEKFSNDIAGASGTWMDIGARPVYSVTQNFNLAVEAGLSSVKYDTDVHASLLKRLTFAAEISPDPKYFARPVMRAFYTTSFNLGNAYGVQGEVWF